MMPFDIPQEEARTILEEMIIPQVIGNALPQTKKEAFILGGQPGSGKSSLAREILQSTTDVVFVNGDDLRAYHSKYYFYLKENDIEAADLTQAVCNFWIESLIQECVSRGINLMVEGTMRRKDVPLTTAKILKENRYSVSLIAVSSPYELSLRSLECRYAELKRLGIPARYTKKESHDEAFNNIENTILELSESGLFERYYIYRRLVGGFQKDVFEAYQKEEMLEAFFRGRIKISEDKEGECFSGPGESACF
jgi:UDP-N-acetylglucosamine kinase